MRLRLLIALAVALSTLGASCNKVNPDAILRQSIIPGHSAELRQLIGNGAQLSDFDDSVVYETAYYAIASNNAEAFGLILDLGIDANHVFADGRTLLSLAAGYDDIDIARHLLAHGADVNAADLNGWRPLHSAASNGSIDVITPLIDAGAEVDACTSSGETALLLAILGNHTYIVRTLIKKGADVKSKLPASQTLLHAAVKTCGAGVVDTLVTLGVDVDAVDSGQRTALHIAVEDGNLAAVRALLAAGATVDAEDLRGLTPLKLALGQVVRDPKYVSEYEDRAELQQAWDDHGEIIEALVAAGADVDAAGKHEKTGAAGEPGEPPLFSAVKFHDDTQVKTLIAAGADVNCVDSKGTPLLCRVCGMGYVVVTSGAGEETHSAVEVLRTLLGAGADPNVADPQTGWTPLHYASFQDPPVIIETLLAAGAKVDAVDNDGWTALHVAASYGFPYHLEALLKGSADPQARTNAGETPLDIARRIAAENPNVDYSDKLALLEQYSK